MALKYPFATIVLIAYTFALEHNGCTVVAVSNTSNSSGNGTTVIFAKPEVGVHANISAPILLRLRDCQEYFINGFKSSGTYQIYPFGEHKEGLFVYCDMDSTGGWTVVQSRGLRGTHRNSFQNNDTDFSKEFGSPCGDFWIGMDVLSALTSGNDQHVRISLTTWYVYNVEYNYGYRNGPYYGDFKKFRIGNATDGNRIFVSDFYSGSDAGSSRLNGSEFMTSRNWEQKCPNKTFVSPGWYNSTDCSTNKARNLFAPLSWCASSTTIREPSGGTCSTEIKIRDPFSIFLDNGERLTSASYRKMIEGFKKKPRDCGEVYLAGNTTAGSYEIFPSKISKQSIFVYCDMYTDGGGWTTILRRGKTQTQQESFNLTWDEYEVGFGNSCGDQFIGLENIFMLTDDRKNELRVDLTDWNGAQAFAHYKTFNIGDLEEEYALSVGNYSGGTAGDSLTAHNSAAFTALGHDQDAWDEGNCAEEYGGGWWYVNCLSANLNGVYLNKTTFSFGQGIVWSSWKGFNYSMQSVEMKIRNSNFVTLSRLATYQ